MKREGAYRKPVYCEWAFLKEYLTIENVSSNGWDFTFPNYNKDGICKLLLSPDINLYLDVDTDQLFDIENEIYRHRQKCAKKGEVYQLSTYEKLIIYLQQQAQSNGDKPSLHIKCLGKKYVGIDELDENTCKLDAVYLTVADSKLCQELMDDYGILVISPDNIEDFTSLQVDEGDAIYENEPNDWTQLLQGKVFENSNTVIIVDNYLLQRTDTFNNNIRPILDAILPHRLKIPLHISIYTLLGVHKNPIRYERIKEILQKIRPNLKYKLSLFDCHDMNLHDRTIVTNNQWIECGAGFDLFRNNRTAINSTSLSIVFPYINQSIKRQPKAYCNLLFDTYTITNGINKPYDEKDKPISAHYYGEKINRLIDNL